MYIYIYTYTINSTCIWLHYRCCILYFIYYVHVIHIYIYIYICISIINIHAHVYTPAEAQSPAQFSVPSRIFAFMAATMTLWTCELFRLCVSYHVMIQNPMPKGGYRFGSSKYVHKCWLTNGYFKEHNHWNILVCVSKSTLIVPFLHSYCEFRTCCLKRKTCSFTHRPLRSKHRSKISVEHHP